MHDTKSSRKLLWRNCNIQTTEYFKLQLGASIPSYMLFTANISFIFFPSFSTNWAFFWHWSSSTSLRFFDISGAQFLMSYFKKELILFHVVFFHYNYNQSCKEGYIIHHSLWFVGLERVGAFQGKIGRSWKG